MADLDAAVGYVVARGDAADRARLSRIRTDSQVSTEIVQQIEDGQLPDGAWPAPGGSNIASVDATCFRLGELDELNALARPSATRALAWLAQRQRLDGSWEEDTALAAVAPPWARPGDPEARFYQTVNAAYWLAVASVDAAAVADPTIYFESPYAAALERAAQAIRDELTYEGGWPGFLVSGWLAAAVMHHMGWFFESARIFIALTDRVKTLAASDAAAMIVALRRIGVNADDSLIIAAQNRLNETQRPDGAWPSNDDPELDVETTLVALRALR